MNELVSVIIPTYGRTKTLKRAINSVIIQSYDHIEIIIIDDNVDPQISAEVRALVASYNSSKIILIKNDHNIGGALSRNQGITASKGDYIAFLDDDDWYYPTKLKKEVELIKSNEKLGLVYCWVESISKDGSVGMTYKYRYRGNLIYDAMYNCMAATSQWLCRKSALLDVGMFSNVPCKQDSTVILKLMLAGYEIDYVPEVLSVYDDGGSDRISTQNHRKRISGEEMLRSLCRKNYTRITKKQRGMVEYSFSLNLAEHYYYEKEYKKLITSLIRILSHPFNKRTRTFLYRVFKKMFL